MGELKKALVRNTVFNVAGYFWTLALGFITTPILIHFIGLEFYGIYVLFGAAMGWLWMLDLGISSAATRFLSRHAAAGDERRFAECLSTTLWVKWIVGLIVLTAALPWAGSIARTFDVQHAAQAGRALQIMAVMYAVTNISSAYNAALAARQRMDIPSKLGIGISIPATAAALAALALGWGLPGFLMVNLCLSITYLVIARTTYRRISNGAIKTSRRFSGREIRGLTTLSARLSICRLIDTFLASADRLALAGNPTYVSLYQLGATVTGRIREFTALVVSASLPAAADLHARGDWAGLDQIFQRGTKYLFLIGFPLTLFAAIFAEEIMMFWLGGRLPQSAVVLRILAAGHFLNVLGAMAASLGAAADRVDLQIRASLAAVVAALAVFFAWGRHHGLAGIASSISTGYAILGITQVISVLAAMRGKLRFPMGEILGRPLAAAIFSATLAGIPAKWISNSYGCASNRVNAALFIGITASAASLLFWAGLKTFKVLDHRDMEAIRMVFRKAPPEAT